MRGIGSPIRTQGFAPAAAWRRRSTPCGLTAGARPLTSRCADGAPARLDHSAISIAAARGRRCITTESNSVPRGRTAARVCLATRSNAGTDGSKACAVGAKRERGMTRPRSRSAVLRRPSAARTRSFPSTHKSAARRKPWLASPRTRTRPCGFSRQGRGKNCRGKRFGEGASERSEARGLRGLRRRLILSSAIAAPRV